MWNAISNGLLKGMGVAGWVIGFIAVLGMFLILAGIVIFALYFIFTADADGEGEAGEDGDA